MATLKTYTVKKGDTLDKIAESQKSIIGSKLTKSQRIQKLRDYNGIAKSGKNKDKIAVGQKLYLNGKPTTSVSNVAKITAFGLQSDTDSTVFAKWEWTKSNTDRYSTVWSYKTADGNWFVGSESDTTNKESTYSAPSNAISVRFKLKPIAKTHTVNKKEVAYWTIKEWTSWQVYDFKSNPPVVPKSVPTVTIENYKLLAYINNVFDNGIRGIPDEVEFQIFTSQNVIYYIIKSRVNANQVSCSVNISAGEKYRVRCRSYRSSDCTYSDWTDYSSEVMTKPNSVDVTSVSAASATSVKLTWSTVSTATSYDIEYATSKDYFDVTDQTQKKTGITNTTTYTVMGLEGGTTYFFRMRAVNSSGESDWSAIKSVIIGTKPAAPTTWSSTTTCISGEELILYWIHNAEDGSSQVRAELSLTINGSTKIETITNTNIDDDKHKDDTSYYTIDTSPYNEGTVIKWKVRTCGITNEYGDWSTERTVDVYAPPTLELQVRDINDNPMSVLTSFPFNIYGMPGPKTQAPIGYHVNIVPNESYETVDNVGSPIFITQGEPVYSQYFDITGALDLDLSAGDIDLETNVTYTVIVTVSMNSGLSAESKWEFSVNWTETKYVPNAEIFYDDELYVAYIRPYCEYTKVEYRVCSKGSGEDEYILTSETISDPKGTEVEDGVTEYGYPVYEAPSVTGGALYYCAVPDCKFYKCTHEGDITEYEATDERVDVADGNIVPGAVTSSGYQIYSTVIDEDDTVYYYVIGNYKYEVNRIDYTRYVKTDEEIDEILNGTLIENAYTKDDEAVYSSTSGTFCIVATNETISVEGVTLSVYRREYDGSYIKLAEGIENDRETFITDPHPALDYARYRIVAVEDSTGSVCYYDTPGLPTGEGAVIIQWSETWSAFDPNGSINGDELVAPIWSGSLLRLPYNIDVSDKYDPDISLVEYIGRKRPVSYYGTQLGESSTWKVDIIKEDTDTLYALRRLSSWLGDCYVREPSGSGYWASVKVSMSQTHDSLVIPVTLDITRVEGTEEATVGTLHST